MTTQELQHIWPEWEIIRPLGEGAFGKVYEIQREEGALEENAALKVIHIPQSESEIKLLQSEGADVSAHFEELARQLSNEIATQAKLKGNSNIVSYEDRKIVPDDDGIGQTILIRMELLTPLVDLMAAGAMVQAEVLRLGLNMARALLLCERFHIIHRDIKPQNIFISPAGDYKLGDFGVARQLEQTTANLSRKGTYNYMAPEVFHGRPCNATVDIYSLGIVLYTLLNGNRAPFLPSSITGATVTNHDRESAQTKRLSGEPLPPLPHVPGVLNEVILRMCAFENKERYQSAHDLMAALESVAYELQGEKTVSLHPWIGDNTTGVVPIMEATTENEGSRWIDGTPVAVEKKLNVEPEPKPEQRLEHSEARSEVEQKQGRKPVGKKVFGAIAAVIFVALAVLVALYGKSNKIALKHFELGNSYFSSELYEEAVDEYSKAIRRARSYPEAYLNRALTYYELKRYVESVDDYRASRSSEHEDKFSLAFYESGLVKLRDKLYSAALLDFSDAISLRSDYAEAYFHQGIAKYGEDEAADVMEDYEKAILLKSALANERSTAYGEIFYQRWLWTMEQDEYDYEEALGFLDKAIAHDSQRKDLYLTRGDAYSSRRDSERKLKDYNKAIELDDCYVEAYAARASLYCYIGEYDKALQDADMVLKLDKKYTDIYDVRADAYWEQEKYDKAFEEYAKWIELDPQNAEPLRWRAMRYRDQENYSDALKDINQAIKLDPRNHMLYDDRGYIYKSMGRYEDALKDFETGFGLDSESTWFLTQRAEIYYENLGQYDKAVQEYERLITLQPDDAYSYIWLANFQEEAGKPKEAEKTYARATDAVTRAIAKDPDNVDLYRQRSRIYEDQGKYNDAINDYLQVIKLEPDDAYNYTSLAYLYESEGKPKDAEKAYAQAINVLTQAIARDPEDADLYCQRASMYVDQRKYSDAIKDLTKAIEIDGMDDEMFFQRGNIYRIMKNYTAALKDYETGFGLDPDDLSHLYHRAEIYFEDLGQYGNAIKEYDRIIKLNPDDAGVYVDRGWCHRLLGNYSMAFADADKALEVSDDSDDWSNARAYNLRGATYNDMGQNDKAIAEYNKALELNPEAAYIYGNRAIAYDALGQYLKAAADRRKAKSLEG